MQREFLTVREVAEQLHTTERTVRALIKKRALPAKKVGTKYIVLMEAVREFLRSEA